MPTPENQHRSFTRVLITNAPSAVNPEEDACRSNSHPYAEFHDQRLHVGPGHEEQISNNPYIFG